MNIVEWIALYGANTLFVWWMVWGGGAAKFMGWWSLIVVDWLDAITWTSEQIALYILIVWVGHTIWFIFGLFAPELRTFFW